MPGSVRSRFATTIISSPAPANRRIETPLGRRSEIAARSF
jgi:hypothetical protein